MTTTITALNGSQPKNASLATKPSSWMITEMLHNIQRRFGQNALIKLNDTTRLEADVIATGIPTLDQALGVGGLPRGRIIDIVGPESSGKTTLCLRIIAEAQRQGASVYLSILNTPWTELMLNNVALIVRISTFHNRTAVRKPWKLLRPWCGLG